MYRCDYCGSLWEALGEAGACKACGGPGLRREGPQEPAQGRTEPLSSWPALGHVAIELPRTFVIGNMTATG